MNRLHLLTLFLTIVICTSCHERHFITDKSYRKEVEKDFASKMDQLKVNALITGQLTSQEKEAIQFLYAYMPLGDAVDYAPELYIESVRTAFKAQKEMPWGDSIPEEIFRHFVLPVRVNNENLDESRMIFYDELKNRVKGLSLYDAVLEVNHWCHEKVVYTPSDARTSSPLASVRTAYGRCGEESTFAVAALRSVGIPARQVYTPRWAHTDDNHAWVEAWVHGTWYFLGACEPEPVLNLGWFNGPAYRSMLMHTKAFGKYTGGEEVMQQTDCYTEINVTANYAPTAKAFVKVTDAGGQPVQDALVEFKIYNYAEFNTVARKQTGADGKTFLSAGKGDLLVWASKDGKFGYNKLSVGKEDEITIALNKKGDESYSFPVDIVPPVEGSIPVHVTDEQKTVNAKRLQEEDAVRNAYVSSFMTKEKANALAKELNIDPIRTERYLLGSRGNWKEIEKFLREAPAHQRATAMALLGEISAKDLRDTPASVLFDHLNHSVLADTTWFNAYVLNPRIANELLTPYKSVIQKECDRTLAEAAKANPQVLVDWCKKEIRLADNLNPQRIPVMPTGVWKAHVADKNSRDIFFVAFCRSLGIPARIESVTGKVQYFYNDRWIDVDFNNKEEGNARQGRVIASYNPLKVLDNPKYYSHFTLAKITNGMARTLNYESDGDADMGSGASWAGLLKEPLTLDEGYYMLVTGTRMANGSVLGNVNFFTVEPDKMTNIHLVMRENAEDVQVIGNLNSEALFVPVGTDKPQSILATTGRGYFVLAILGARQEPTNHVMRDLVQFSKEYEAWGRQMVFLFQSEEEWNNFDAKEFQGLPSNITFGMDTNKEITNMLVKAMHLPNDHVLPIFVIGDTFNRIVFVSQGYNIGLGEQMLKVIHKL
ncbi:transglutaminase domain-containing protein [Parabacteroides pacaensis]|uniref:transglutaminase domain-containing protein n=1 Tax=Parabacteroides pacaensis TaxID=2086575 RepID=UPI000D105D2B|nr:transglutaminase domain-containing protein [Parabacteroides pacaensis]